MNSRTKLTVLLAATLYSAAAVSDPIQIQTYEDYDDIPGNLGIYDTDPYTISDAIGSSVSSFTTDSGNVINMSPGVEVISENWVDDPDNETIFGVPGRFVTLTPTNPLGALSFMIHSSFGGGAWVSAQWEDAHGNSGTVRNPPGSGHFGINQGQLDGVGVGLWAEPGVCITSVTIEPPDWGFGSISTADARPCVSVPEPGSLTLLGLGLLVLGFGSLARRGSPLA